MSAPRSPGHVDVTVIQARRLLVRQTQDQAHSIESAGIHCLCVACTEHSVYLVLITICCPRHKKYGTSAVCSRSSQLKVAKVLTELHVPNRLDNAGQITVIRYALFSVAVPHTLGSCRWGRTQAKGQPKRAVKWRNVKVRLASCGRSGSSVTVTYRNGLLEPMHPGHDRASGFRGAAIARSCFCILRGFPACSVYVDGGWFKTRSGLTERAETILLKLQLQAYVMSSTFAFPSVITQDATPDHACSMTHHTDSMCMTQSENSESL